MSTRIDERPDRPELARRGILGAMLGATALALPTVVSAAEIGFAGVLGAPPPVTTLAAFTRRLATAPRRRSFASTPFMVTARDGWDGEAAAEILAFPMRRQMWEFSDIEGPALGLMREALNCQAFTFKNPDFLVVSATHGLAHLGLFNQSSWDKYRLAALTGGKVRSNTLIIEKSGVQPSDSIQDLQGFYGPNNNNITSLQRRGVVFVACHDSIHAISRAVVAAGAAAGPPDAVAGDLTNNLIAGAVLVPSVVGFMEELQRQGFSYAKG